MNTTTMNNLTDLQNELKCEDSASPPLGVQVYWTIPQDITVQLDEFNTRIEQAAHLPDYLKLSRPAPKTALTRAAAWYAKENPGMAVRKVTDNADRVVRAFVGEEVNEHEREINLSNYGWVSLRKADGVVTFSDRLNSEVVMRFTDLVNSAYGVVDQAAIRSFLLESIAIANGFTMRSSGGIYFVPESSWHVVNDALSLVSDLVPDAALYTVTIWGTKSTLETMRAAFQDDMLAELAQFEKRLNGWLESGRDLRVVSVTTRAKDLAELRQQALVYRDLLGHRFGDLESKIGDLENELTTIKDGIESKAAQQKLQAQEEDDELEQENEAAAAKPRKTRTERPTL